MRYWRKKVLAIKAETVYGTDAVPADANVIRAHDVTMTTLEADRVDRSNVAPYMGAGQTWLVGQRVKLDFKVEAAGAGAAGTAPKYGPLHRMCAMAEVVTAATKVEYFPASANHDAASIYFNMDGVLHKGVGARGKAGLELARKAPPVWTYSVTGLYVAPTEVAQLGTTAFADFKDPVIPSPVNTPTVTLNGVPLIMDSFKAMDQTDAAHVMRVNAERVTKSDHIWGGEMVVEQEALATFNPYALANAHALMPLQIVHGTVAGSIIGVAAPKVQIVGVSEVELEGGVAGYNLQLSFKPDTGDDEIAFTVK